jgi:TPR repeat protein
VAQDYAEAARWFRKAAEQGDATEAQFRLGHMYYQGQGVPQDHAQAHMWFDLAISRGETEISEGWRTVAAEMTPPEIAEVERLVRKWSPTRGAGG